MRSRTLKTLRLRKSSFMKNKNCLQCNFDAVCVLLLLTNMFCNVHAVRNVGHNTAINDRNGLKGAVHSSFSQGGNFLPALNVFSHQTVIRPEIHHGSNKRVIRSTLESKNGLHVPQISMSYFHDGRRVLIDLKLNDKLLPDEHFLRYQNSKTQTGHVVKKNFTKTELKLCHYQGSIRGKPESTVAVSTCEGGINGVVFDGTDTYFIHSGSDGQLHEHYLLRHTNLLNRKTTGGYRRNEDVSDLHDHGEDLEAPRKTLGNNMIRGPYNANRNSSFVELVIVVDNKVYKALRKNINKVHQYCKDMANIVNAFYVPLNIFVILIGVVIWNKSNEIEFSSDGDVTLRNFLDYRRDKLVIQHPNDHAHLLTGQTFDIIVGKAIPRQICSHNFSGGLSVMHSHIIAEVASTMAHELGHNFGMKHDTSDCKCQDEKCIMSESIKSPVGVRWSSCSIDQLNESFSSGINHCLRNKPTKLFDSPQCGNGFVEPGEQCDCGLQKYCENTCCDAETCMLHANASCATGECCDLSTCRPKAAGMECRGADNECDLPEYCTGESEYCPADVFKRDTDSCDENRAYCFQGTCRSHTNQCRLLWGPTGESSEHCYKFNLLGDYGGNCGLNRIYNSYIPCKQENVNCGRLHCRSNSDLIYGKDYADSMEFEGDKNGLKCARVIFDLDLKSLDPGMVPNGAKCGTDKMCVNQKCRLVTQLRADGMGKACPNNCSGNGYCNSRGNCHCDRGFFGPDCTMPGHGGSPDSGPATNPNSNAAFQRFMYIFFFAVLPLVAAFFFFMYYCRNHPFFVGGKFTENMYVSTPRTIGSFSTSSPSTSPSSSSHFAHTTTSSSTTTTNASTSPSASPFPIVYCLSSIKNLTNTTPATCPPAITKRPATTNNITRSTTIIKTKHSLTSPILDISTTNNINSSTATNSPCNSTTTTTTSTYNYSTPMLSTRNCSTKPKQAACDESSKKYHIKQSQSQEQQKENILSVVNEKSFKPLPPPPVGFFKGKQIMLTKSLSNSTKNTSNNNMSFNKEKKSNKFKNNNKNINNDKTINTNNNDLSASLITKSHSCVDMKQLTRKPTTTPHILKLKEITTTNIKTSSTSTNTSNTFDTTTPNKHTPSVERKLILNKDLAIASVQQSNAALCYNDALTKTTSTTSVINPNISLSPTTDAMKIAGNCTLPRLINKTINKTYSNNNNKSNSNKSTNNNNYKDNNNRERRKVEITDIRLHSTTNPLALADGAAYTLNSENRCVYTLHGRQNLHKP